MKIPNFIVKDNGPISSEFLKRNLTDFISASNYIAGLPYNRNSDKNNPSIVFIESCGTCSTKHATLKLLADENGCNDIKLCIGIYKMSALNTKPIKQILAKHQLDYIPEAHCYLKYANKILDYTFSANHIDFSNDLLYEEEIDADMITAYKNKMHVMYLQKWIDDHEINMPLSDIWALREACIQALSI